MTAFYVDAKTGSDSTDGSQSKPFKTITKAAATAVAGDAVFVLPGEYTETVRLPKSGQLGKPIQFKSLQKHGASVGGVFEVIGKSYLSFSDFKVHGGNYGFRLEGQCKGVSILGNHIQGTFSSGVSAWGVPYKAQPSTFSWKGIQDLVVVGNWLDRCCDGGWNEIMSFANGVDGLTVTDNWVYNPGSTANGGEGPDLKCGVRNAKYLRNVHGLTPDRKTVTGLNKVATYIDGGIAEVGLYSDPWNGICQDIEVGYNEYYNCGAGINLSSEAAGSILRVNVHNNWFEPGSKTRHSVLIYRHPKAQEWAPKTYQYCKIEDITVTKNAVIGGPIGFIVNCGIGKRLSVNENMPYQAKTPYQLIAGSYTCDKKISASKPLKSNVLTLPTPAPTPEPTPAPTPAPEMPAVSFAEAFSADVKSGNVKPIKASIYYTEDGTNWKLRTLT